VSDGTDVQVLFDGELRKIEVSRLETVSIAKKKFAGRLSTAGE
jgi:hypothetical protein